MPDLEIKALLHLCKLSCNLFCKLYSERCKAVKAKRHYKLSRLAFQCEYFFDKRCETTCMKTCNVQHSALIKSRQKYYVLDSRVSIDSISFPLPSLTSSFSTISTVLSKLISVTTDSPPLKMITTIKHLKNGCHAIMKGPDQTKRKVSVSCRNFSTSETWKKQERIIW